MKTIYIDADFKCHINNDGAMRAVETNVFDGMCDAYIEGWRYVPSGESWTRADGVVFHGEMVSPWKPLDELDEVQRDYERKKLAEYETALSEIEAALGV